MWPKPLLTAFLASTLLVATPASLAKTPSPTPIEATLPTPGVTSPQKPTPTLRAQFVTQLAVSEAVAFLLWVGRYRKEVTSNLQADLKYKNYGGDLIVAFGTFLGVSAFYGYKVTNKLFPLHKRSASAPDMEARSSEAGIPVAATLALRVGCHASVVLLSSFLVPLFLLNNKVKLGFAVSILGALGLLSLYVYDGVSMGVDKLLSGKEGTSPEQVTWLHLCKKKGAKVIVNLILGLVVGLVISLIGKDPQAIYQIPLAHLLITNLLLNGPYEAIKWLLTKREQTASPPSSPSQAAL